MTLSQALAIFHFLCFIFVFAAIYTYTYTLSSGSQCNGKFPVCSLTIYDFVSVSQRVSPHINAASLSFGTEKCSYYFAFSAIDATFRCNRSTHTLTPHQYKMSPLNLNHQRKSLIFKERNPFSIPG